MIKIHFHKKNVLNDETIWLPKGICGQWYVQTTKDKKQVTCKKCLKKIEKNDCKTKI